MVERFEDVYKFTVEGNFEAELNRLNARLAEARAGFSSLASKVNQSGAQFSKTQKEFAQASKSLREFTAAEQEILNVLPAQEAISTAAQVQAKAYNALVREVNKLNVARLKESQAVQQSVTKTGQPKLIQLRAETNALQSLSRQLQKVAEKEAFRAEASRIGLGVSADGTRLFDQQAEAAQRAAEAIERVGLAEATRQALGAQGRDASGKLFQVQNGALTAAGRQSAVDIAAEKERKAVLDAEVASNLKNNEAYIEAVKAAKAARAEIANLTGTGEKAEGVFNRVSFTFRRLIGIMAVFTVARQVVGGFNNMIATAIRFNAEIESSRVGLAGLIAASAEIRAPSGAAIGLDDQILETQNIAIQQMNELRKDALKTAASYDELSRAFNSAVAPGLQAGLALDQIRNITVSISQAATGLGLAQDQLAEEIRSLFAGTISARNTRIATALGISNEDINRAKELGNLFQFLEGRFAAISKTGKLLMNTFTGQLSNATDAFKQLLATSSQPLFEQLKAGLADIQSALFDATKDVVVFDPQILAAFKGLFEGLANGVKGIRAAFAAVDLDGFAGVLEAIGQALGAAATLIANAFTTLFNVAAPTVTILSKLLEGFTLIATVIRGISGPFGAFVSGIVISVAKVALLVVTTRKLASGFKSLYLLLLRNLGVVVASDVATKSWVLNFSGLVKAAKAVAASLGRLLVPVLALVAGVALLDGILAALGSEFRVSDAITGVFDSILNKIDESISGVKGLKEELTEPVKSPFGIVQNDFRELKTDLQEFSRESKQTLEKLKTDLAATVASLGLPGGAADIVSDRINRLGAFESADKIKELVRSIQQLEQSQKEVSSRLQDNGAKFAKNAKQAKELEEGALKAAKDKLSEVEKQRALEDSLRKKTETEFVNGNVQLALIEAVQKRISLERELAVLIQDNQDATNKSKALTGEKDALQGKLTADLESERSLREQLLELQRGLNKEIAASAQKIVEPQIQQSLESFPDLQFTLKEAQAASRELLELSKTEEIVMAKRLEIEKLNLSFRKEETARKLEITALDEQAAKLSASQSEEAQAAAARMRLLLSFRKDELDVLQQTNIEQQRKLALEADIANLRATGTTGQGAFVGLAQFAADNKSLFGAGERLGTDLANGISEFGGQAIADAFNPNANSSLRESLGNLFLSLGSQLATDLLKNLLSQLLQALGVNLTSSFLGLSAGASALTSAGGVVNAAAVATGTSAASLAAAGNTVSIAAAAISAAAAQLAAASASSTASSTISTAALVAATGGPVSKLQSVRMPNVRASHARAPGFAAGGRPRGRDPRDTIPAWLRHGEWVIRPEAVGFYGDRIFDMLNHMKISPSALRGIATAGHARQVPVAKRSFATGGPVVMSSKSSSSGVTQVLQFNDEQTMDRALAAGPESMVRFARARRGAYRSALGLDPS